MARSITTFQNCSHSIRRAESSLADHAFVEGSSITSAAPLPDLVDGPAPGSMRSDSGSRPARSRQWGDGDSALSFDGLDPLSAATTFGSQVSTIRIFIACLPVSLRSSHDLLCEAHSPGSKTSASETPTILQSSPLRPLHQGTASHFTGYLPDRFGQNLLGCNLVKGGEPEMILSTGLFRGLT